MEKEVSNNEILRAIFELGDQVDEISQEQKKMGKELKEIKFEQQEMRRELNEVKVELQGIRQEQKSIRQELVVMEKRLSDEIKKVGEKIEIVSNRLLDTEADVRALKRMN